MKDGKSNWEEEGIRVALQLKRAEAPPFLFTRIEQAITQVDIIPLKNAGFVFAGVALLIYINYFLLQYRTDQTNTTRSDINFYSATQYNLYES